MVDVSLHSDLSSRIYVQPSPRQTPQRNTLEIFDDIVSEYKELTHRIKSRPCLDEILIVVPHAKAKSILLSIGHELGLMKSETTRAQKFSHPLIRISILLLQGAKHIQTYDEISTYLEQEAPVLRCLDEKQLFNTLNSLRRKKVIGSIFKEIHSFFIEHFSHLENKSHLSNDVAAIFSSLEESKIRGSLDDGLNCLTRAITNSHQLDTQSRIMIVNIFEPLIRKYNTAYVTSLTQPYNLDQVQEWLRPHVKNISLSTHAQDMNGREVTINTFPFLNHVRRKSPQIYDSNPDITSISFLEKLLSKDLNNVNALALNRPFNSLSPTAIETYAQCPSKFFYSYVLKLSDIDSSSNKIDPRLFGTFIHACLDDIAQNSRKESEIDDIITTNLKTVYPHKQNILLDTSYRMRAERILNKYFNHERTNPSKITAHEKSIEGSLKLPTIQLQLRGKIDRIQKDNEGLHIVDYKTGRWEKSEDPFHFGRRIQLGIYALIYQQNISSVQYWHTRQDQLKIDTIKWDQNLQDRLLEMVDSIAALINKGVFIPRNHNDTGKSKIDKGVSPCDKCPFTSCCPSQLRELWALHRDSTEISSYAHSTSKTSDTLKEIA